MAMQARRPMFFLKPADGAIGAHFNVVLECHVDFRKLGDRPAKPYHISLTHA